MGLNEAQDLLDEAYTCNSRAEDLLKRWDYSGSVQASQLCIELSVKSLFRLVDLPYPHQHDPTGTKGKKPSEEDKVKGIKKVLDKLEFPEGSLYKQNISRSTWISKMSEEFHTSTIYGYLGVVASKIFEKKDAEFLSNYASEVRDICGRVVNDVRTGRIIKREERKALKKEVYKPLLNNVNAILRALPLITLGIWESDAAIRTKLEKDDKDLFDEMNEFYGNVNEYNSHIENHKHKQAMSEYAAGNSGYRETAKTIEEKIASINKLGEELLGKLRKKL